MCRRTTPSRSIPRAGSTRSASGPRRSGTRAPRGPATSSNYGGTRLALQPGDALKIRLVNTLPLLDPVKVTHSKDPGGANLPMNLTNLHTHGLIVQARAPTLSDPTFGDYVFVEIYNPANGTPVPQTTHQHGSIVKEYADYRIDIPANHPDGAFWFHPHVHGIALNQVASGLAGIISIGSVGQYAHGDRSNAAFPDANVRHLVLKDMQVLAAGNIMFENGPANVANGEVLAQQDPDFCSQYPVLPTEVRKGSCPGADLSNDGGNDYTGGTWFFTVSGQQYPTITLSEPDGEMWRLTNASGSLSYDLQLMNNVTAAPMVMQLVSVDGVSINVPPGTSLGQQVQIAGARFSLVRVPRGAADRHPELGPHLHQRARHDAELARRSLGQLSGRQQSPGDPAARRHRRLEDDRHHHGAGRGFVARRRSRAGRIHPDLVPEHRDLCDQHLRRLARRDFRQAASSSPRSPMRRPSAPVAGCKPLATGHHRRVFFGLADYNNPSSFGLGYEEIDQNGVAVPGTQVPITQFDPSVTTVCLPLGPGQTPVHETWELINLATENHNFHMHQTKFRSLGQGPAGTVIGGTPIPATGGILEDNVPLSTAVPKDLDFIVNTQNGYCTIAQWYRSICTSLPLFVDIPFSQLGEFVFHCHILEHEDGGMMAKIQVVSTPSTANTHDYNGDGASDMAWRDQIGNAALWLMNGTAAAASGGFSGVPGSWSIVGHRDFDGDGNYDLLWRDTSGNTAIWFLNGTQIASSAAIGNIPVGWTVVATGDFDGDGKGDILWQDASGNLAMWLMNGAAVVSSGGLGNVPAPWSLVGAGDFDGDGRSDLLWRDGSGNTSIWFMNGTQVASMASVGNVPIAWSVVGTGDFDGNGKSDIIWRDGSGNTAIWLMSGATVAATGALGGIPTSWSIVQTGDYNADGKSDLLWRDGSGNTSIWFMNGAQVATAAAVGNVPTAWTVQSVNAD